MVYTDTEQELNAITDNLEDELYTAGAISPEGKVINVKLFNQIIDEKITECNAISARMEASGKRFDANSANIIGARIEFLRAIKDAQSLTPFAKSEPQHEDEIIQNFENQKKTDRFLKGSKILGVFKRIFRGKPAQNHVRGK
ncbi:MAG: hypothetical protein J5613_03185 [Alphaproteobacteria bacterium]|nr:hypothetical protein [Alphaproteobacteria bacterium]